MTEKNPKNLSQLARRILPLLYICLVFNSLILLESCVQHNEARENSESQKRPPELQSKEKRIARTPSHMLANRIGNDIYNKLNSSGDQGKELDKERITPFSPESSAYSKDKIENFTYLKKDGNANLIAQKKTNVGEIESFGGVEEEKLIELQSKRAKKKLVTCRSMVYKTLPDDLKGSRHQRFLLKLSNGTTVLVAHNIDLAPKIPLKPGDYVDIKGEYIWNPKGGVLHYTHHATSFRHQGGWIKHSGKTYK